MKGVVISLVIHESRLPQAPLRRALRMWHFYLKKKVEIATLPSVARNDSALLEVVVHQQIARDDVVVHRSCVVTK